ncbi:MAG: hypothetical protein ACW963_08940, partial [Candidatus Sifarchaeia archaeon]
MSKKKSKPRRTQQLICVPVYGLTISPDLGREIQIENVLFVSSKKIPLIRKRLGLKQRIAEYDKQRPSYYRKELFSEASTYALVKTLCDPNSQDLTAEFNRIRDAFWILMSSQLDVSKRGRFVVSLKPLQSYRLYQNVI